ncbi:MAG: amidohydrolase family protein [Acidimicrobiia bacterium]
MRLRANLRSPFGEVVTRDVVDGRWAEPSGAADDTIGQSMWALPGLADAHAHLAARELNTEPGNLSEAVQRARDALTAGLTLILDKGWCDDTVVQLISQMPSGTRPDIEAAARIIATEGGYFGGFGHEIDGSEIDKTVRESAGEGAGWVKLIGDWPRRGVGPRANFTPDELATAVTAAEAGGARVAIHTMAREVPSQAVAAGVHSIEHGIFLEEADLAPLGSRGGMWVPTVQRVETTVADLGAESSGGRLLTEGLERIRRLLPLALEAGVHVLAGTDLIGSPAAVAAEAIRLGDYGLTSRQVVAAVSTSVFDATGRDSAFTPGTTANGVFFPANPVEDVAVLSHPALVMRRGELV